ncbi:MAG: hypothetical protein PHT84_05040 [Candidatus Pacebacteria bacterium]|nr:hypothetical protein [Candidatus Paceibacterota bacterium]
MNIEQFVIAYGVEQDRLRAILPDGFSSLRPVLRINAEVRDEKCGYVEFNTAIEKDGKKGWLNIGHWNNVIFERNGKKVIFKTDFLTISFKGVGIEGSCPAEKDNAGCYFLKDAGLFRPVEAITANKEFCDCEFAWNFGGTGAHGVSIGKTLPAIPTEVKTLYPKHDFTVENAAQIPCEQVLGTYMVKFAQ